MAIAVYKSKKKVVINLATQQTETVYYELMRVVQGENGVYEQGSYYYLDADGNKQGISGVDGNTETLDADFDAILDANPPVYPPNATYTDKQKINGKKVKEKKVKDSGAFGLTANDWEEVV